MGSAVPTESHNTIMAAYRTFEAGGTNNNAFALMQTALQSIDSAVMQGLVSGGDVTGLVALRSQMESGLSGNVRQSVFGSRTVNAKAMADAVTLLMKLPVDVQGALDTDALSQAYFDFLTADKKGKTAAQEKAVEVLFASAEAAIASGKLDAVAVQELQGLMAEIDSERSVEDNEKIANEDATIFKKNKKSMTPDEFRSLREFAKTLEATPENAIEVGSEKTWKEYLKYNPSTDLKKSAKEYIELIINTNAWPVGYIPKQRKLPIGSTIYMVMSNGQLDTFPGGWEHLIKSLV